MIAGGGALWHGLFRSGNEQMPVTAIEHENIAGLCGNVDRGNRAPAIVKIDQARLRGHIHIPEIVMHVLERPAQLAGRNV